MSGQPHDHFDLTQFVLGYLEEQGSIVAPADFGIFDVLLPDELAAQLALDGYQRISFSAPGAPDATSQPALPADVLQLGVNHPLVETMAAAAAAKPAHARAYINAVRIDKQGLPDLVRKQFVLRNARVDTAPKAFPQAELHHYLLFNFKVALVSEEKQEELATVVMNVQAGCAVRDPALLTRLEVLDTEPGHEGLDAAAPRWGESGLPLGAETFAALLPRARQPCVRTCCHSLRYWQHAPSATWHWIKPVLRHTTTNSRLTWRAAAHEQVSTRRSCRAWGRSWLRSMPSVPQSLPTCALVMACGRKLRWLICCWWHSPRLPSPSLSAIVPRRSRVQPYGTLCCTDSNR